MEKEKNISIESYKNSDYEKFRKYERFQFLINNIDFSNANSLLDIGCAKGELIYLLKEKYPNIKYTGLEYSQELIDIALKEPFLKGVKFIKGDAQSFDLQKEFDIVVMSGVLSIFDEIDKVLKIMTKHIKNGGYGYIFGGFNIEDIDVIMRYRNNNYSNEWESGWNIFSISTIKKTLLNICDIYNFEYKKFNLHTNLKKSNNPVNSYTIQTKDNQNLIVTGGGIIRDFYLIKFQKG